MFCSFVSGDDYNGPLLCIVAFLASPACRDQNPNTSSAPFIGPKTPNSKGASH